MKLLKTALVALACLLSASAFAQRALVPIVDYKDVTVASSSGKPLTAEQVREAIAVGGRKLGWDMGATADGGLVGTLNVRNKHIISVEIKVAPERYSVFYRSSSNMKYRVDGAGAVIHPAYNQWVQNLVTMIDSELRKL